MGANEMRFGWLDDADFRALVDARAAQKFNHLRGLVLAYPARVAAQIDDETAAGRAIPNRAFKCLAQSLRREKEIEPDVRLPRDCEIAG
jgi:hypothetical protein